MSFAKQAPTIIRLDIRSRRMQRKSYRVHVEYEPSRDGVDGIKRFCCDCKNGRRTIGCRSHVATVVYYLAYARRQQAILRPAAFYFWKFNDMKEIVIFMHELTSKLGFCAPLSRIGTTELRLSASSELPSRGMPSLGLVSLSRRPPATSHVSLLESR